MKYILTRALAFLMIGFGWVMWIKIMLETPMVDFPAILSFCLFMFPTIGGIVLLWFAEYGRKR